MAGNNNLNNHVFHKDSTQIGTGADFNINYDTSFMNIQFITSGTFVAVLKAKLIDSDTWYPYYSLKVPTGELMSGNITEKSCLYQVDLTAISALRVELTSVDGALSCYGKAVG
jgi:hypothetical protein